MIAREHRSVRQYGPLILIVALHLLEILEDRHGRASTIVTSQLPVEYWHEAIGDPTLADAILDRVRAFLRISGSHALTSQRPQAQTYRRKHAKSRRPQLKP